MKTITEKAQIERCQDLVCEMTEYRTEFSPQWLTRSGWKVVPAESGDGSCPKIYRALCRD